eukprot:scaffold4503_cov167-Amphora_coffeaeformis.AAC.6
MAIQNHSTLILAQNQKRVVGPSTAPLERQRVAAILFKIMMMMMAISEGHSPQEHRKRKAAPTTASKDEPRKERPVVLTEEEQRRQIRYKQRQLKALIVTGPVLTEDSLVFQHARRMENNLLFQSVKCPREAVLDADNQNLLVKQGLIQVEKRCQGARFDANRLTYTLRTTTTTSSSTARSNPSGTFNWKLLGQTCVVGFRGHPVGLSLLVGLINQEYESVVRRRARKYYIHDDFPEVIPDEITTVSSNKPAAMNTLSAAEQEVKRMRKLLKRRGKEEVSNDGKVDGVQFLMNPHSFTQSVENIFGASFLVKQGRAAMGVNSNEGLWLQYRREEEDSFFSEYYDEPSSSSTQSMVCFTMKDWRRICAAHTLLEKGDIPHRPGGKRPAGEATTTTTTTTTTTP